MTVSTNEHIFQSTISGYSTEVVSQQIILLCSVQRGINNTQMSASFSTCEQQRSRYQNVIHFCTIKCPQASAELVCLLSIQMFCLHVS